MAAHADLRDGRYFLTFASCPDENDSSLDFYDLVENSFLTPKHHWCLLAEIVNVEYFLRLRLTVKDKSGCTFPIAFYLDDDTELHQESYLKGHTLAILYPHQHGFLDCTIGIRQEELSHVKIIPASLAELMSMSDAIQSQAIKVDGKQVCHACSKISDKALKCARCQLFWYCDKKCQEVGWHVKGHKMTCQVLKDRDMQGLFRMEWNKFDGYWRFPLRSSHAY